MREMLHTKGMQRMYASSPFSPFVLPIQCRKDEGITGLRMDPVYKLLSKYISGKTLSSVKKISLLSV